MKTLENPLWNLTYQMDADLLADYTYDCKISFTVGAVGYLNFLISDYIKIL